MGGPPRPAGAAPPARSPRPSPGWPAPAPPTSPGSTWWWTAATRSPSSAPRPPPPATAPDRSSPAASHAMPAEAHPPLLAYAHRPPLDEDREHLTRPVYLRRHAAAVRAPV